MHLIILIVFVALAAIIVWIADWTAGGEGPSKRLSSLQVDIFAVDPIAAGFTGIAGRNRSHDGGERQ